MIIDGEDIVETFYEKELQKKTNQTEMQYRYMLYKMSQHFLEPYERSVCSMNIELYLSNYATATNLKASILLMYLP